MARGQTDRSHPPPWTLQFTEQIGPRNRFFENHIKVTKWNIYNNKSVINKTKYLSLFKSSFKSIISTINVQYTGHLPGKYIQIDT